MAMRAPGKVQETNVKEAWIKTLAFENKVLSSQLPQDSPNFARYYQASTNFQPSFNAQSQGTSDAADPGTIEKFGSPDFTPDAAVSVLEQVEAATRFLTAAKAASCLRYSDLPGGDRERWLRNPQVAGPILAARSGSDSDIRRLEVVANLLSAMGRTGVEAIVAALDWPRKRTPESIEALLRALRWVDERYRPAEGLREVLLSLLGHSDPDVRESAATTVAEVLDPKEWRDILSERLSSEDDSDVSGAILELLEGPTGQG